MSIKVIGAGFGRTGTSSLKAALEELGFDKCYHMREVFANPKHAAIWKAGYLGQPIDWDALFQGYQATVDWPGCTFYKELMQHYPDAKVLLSVRDPEKWHTSALNTIYGIAQASRSNSIIRLIPRMRSMMSMLDTMVWSGTFHGKFADQQYAIDIFNRHNEEVKRYVPPERLLVYDVKQGWEPLCRFLGVPVPSDKPFPHVNDTAEFQRIVKQRARRMRLAFRVVLSVVALFTGWLVLRMWRRS